MRGKSLTCRERQPLSYGSLTEYPLGQRPTRVGSSIRQVGDLPKHLKAESLRSGSEKVEMTGLTERIGIEMGTTGDSATGYSAVRNGGAGLIDLSSRGRLVVGGSEAVMFLNGLITNDMKTLAVNTWMPAAFANVQGRLLAVVRVIHREDGFLIDTEDVTHDTVLKILERFTLAGDFRVMEGTNETVLLSIPGKSAESTMRAGFGDGSNG